MPRLTGALAALALGALVLPAYASTPSSETACSLAVPNPTVLATGETGALRRVARATGGNVVGGIPRIGALEVAFTDQTALAHALPALRAVARTVDVEGRYTTLDTPGDPLYRRQWALAKVKAPKAWSIEAGTSSPVTVAVLDTGADFDHPDLKGKLLDGFDTLNPGAKPQDDHTHGTHVSGIIAAATNNKIGIAGMSWGAKILPVKTMDANGSGTLCNIVASILWIADQAPDVLNMSIGGPGPCPAALQEALDLAYQRGVTSIAAAGNSGGGLNLPNNPANCDHTIGVGATDMFDNIASFSNYGSYVDVAAPGVAVLSTVVDPKKKVHTYAEFSGTSMASPMVAGLAALLAAKYPTWTPDQITQRILTTADDLGPQGWDQHFGRGRINALKALS